MPNGRPGDNEITDILVHDRKVFGGGVDQEVVTVVRDFPHAKKELAVFVAGKKFAAADGKVEERRRLLRGKIQDIRAREGEKAQRRAAYGKLRRPFPVWLITVFLAYTVLGTLLTLGDALGGERSFDFGVIALGMVSAVISVWLIGQIWSEGPKQMKLAWALVGVTALIYVYAILLFEPEPGAEVPARTQYMAAAVLGLVMVGVHMLIPWYLARRNKARERMT